MKKFFKNVLRKKELFVSKYYEYEDKYKEIMFISRYLLIIVLLYYAYIESQLSGFLTLLSILVAIKYAKETKKINLFDKRKKVISTLKDLDFHLSLQIHPSEINEICNNIVVDNMSINFGKKENIEFILNVILVLKDVENIFCKKDLKHIEPIIKPLNQYHSIIYRLSFEDEIMNKHLLEKHKEIRKKLSSELFKIIDKLKDSIKLV